MTISMTDNITAKMSKLKEMLQTTDFSDVLTAGINVGMGVFKQRVFNKGEDVNNTSLGGYISKSYARKRTSAGRQTGYKDLEFTGALRNSIDLVTIDSLTVQCQLTDPNLAAIAHYQEGQTKTIIFKFSLEEKDIAKVNSQRLLQQKINVRG